MKKMLPVVGLLFMVSKVWAGGTSTPTPILIPSALNVSSASTSGAPAQITIATPTSVGPYSSGYYNYITNVHIEEFAAANLTGLAGPLLCTSTALNGVQWGFSTVTSSGVVNTTDVQYANPLQGTQASTVFISCPAATNVKWNINVGYYQGS
jgi:hypothetical protein